jgi:hypothetical protein
MPDIEPPAQTATRSDPATPIDMDATLFAAVELSLSSWVVLASAAGTNRTSKHGLPATARACSPCCGGCRSAPSGAAAGRSRWSSCRKPAVTGSGFTAYWKRTGHAALLSIRPPLR